MSEKRSIWLSITGKVRQDDGAEDYIEFETEGKMFKKSESDYLMYEESEVSGMEGTTTTVKIEQNKISIIRLGTTNTHMEFEMGKKKINLYATPYGDMSMGIFTKNVMVKYNNSKNPTNIHINYYVEINGLFSTTNSLDIKVKQ